MEENEDKVTMCREKYWEYITTLVIKALENAEDYDLIDFKMMKFDLMYNLMLMMESEEKFNDEINELRRFGKGKRL